MSSARACIFDLDGTLIDSIVDIGASANRVLSARGLPTHAVAAYRGFIGRGVEEMLRRATPDRVHPELDHVVAEFRADYWEQPVVETALFPGIRELLDALKARDVPMAVLSNKPHEFTVRIVGELFQDDDFRAVYGHRRGTQRKPDPASALELAERIGAEPEAITFVGDSQVDVDTARRAGMQVAFVDHGYGFAEDVTPIPVDALVALVTGDSR